MGVMVPIMVSGP
jgi:hypothetical protein